MILLTSSFLGTIWEQVLAAAFYSFAILSVGWLWGRWRTIRVWRSKQFKDRVVLALNAIDRVDQKVKLSLRTLFERDIHQVFQNDSMVDIVSKAIDSIPAEGSPLLPLEEKDSWYVLNAVLNQIAEQFAWGTIRKDMDVQVKSSWYTFCLTFEKEGTIRMQKLRIILIRKDELLNFPDEGEVLLETEKHSTRVKTLRYVKQELKKNPHWFMDIEICD